MTRRFTFRFLSGAALALMLVAPGWAATFGKVVAIGGAASDIVLDERRNVLYIANFTANRIEVMNTSDHTISRSINVNPQPGSIALSPDGRYLVVGHYDNVVASNGADAIPQSNSLTVLNLEDNTRRSFALGNSPLGIAFGSDSLALVLTTGEFLLFDPATGSLKLQQTIEDLVAKTLPQPAGTFPPQITTGSVSASGDGSVIYGVTDTILFRYVVQGKNLSVTGYTASPTLGPRVASVSQNGEYFALGWAVSRASFGRFLSYQFPIAGGALNIGTHAIDSTTNTIYAQVPEQAAPPAPPASSRICLPDGRCITITNPPATNATPSVESRPANLMIADVDNLAVRERLLLAENLGGRSLLNRARDAMYSISDSGVTVFPVGTALRNIRRVAASQEDVVFRTNACDKRVVSQEITISDPGGGRTDFTLTALSPGVTISPSSGTTPARVRILYEPSAFENQKGTSSITVRLRSVAAVNIPQDIRVLVNNHETDQRGAFFSIPGRLVDILPDPDHDRYYVLRQDKNQVLVFDAATNLQTATLRTGSTPTQMAITLEGKYLLVGHNDAHFISVFDLDTLQPSDPVFMQGGHYPRSIAVSGRAILAASRVAGPIHMISRVDLATRTASAYTTLGIYKNDINIDTVLVASPNGSSIMGAMADGTTILYSASADTFTVARKDFTSLSGAYAASSYGQFVVGNNILNASLVSTGQLGAGSGTGAGISAGVAFINDLAIRTSSADATGPGVIQKIDLARGTGYRATRMVESPIFNPPTPAVDPAAPVTPAVVQVDSFVFRRTLAPLINRGMIVSLSQSGFTVLPTTYDSPVAIPRLGRLVNAADQTRPVAPGGLISVIGTDLSPVNVATRETPVPTALADSCLMVNGISVPLLFVSGTQINAQLPFNIEGNSQMVLKTPGGVSDTLNFTIASTAPSVFRTPSFDGESDLATVIRVENQAVVSESNPVRPGDDLIIYATGLGKTSPAVEAGAASPSEPLAIATMQPDVALGGAALTVGYAGLAPGGVGVYQINVRAPGGITAGASVPLTIRQGGAATTVNVQVSE